MERGGSDGNMLCVRPAPGDADGERYLTQYLLARPVAELLASLHSSPDGLAASDARQRLQRIILMD